MLPRNLGFASLGKHYPLLACRRPQKCVPNLQAAELDSPHGGFAGGSRGGSNPEGPPLGPHAGRVSRCAC